MGELLVKGGYLFSPKPGATSPIFLKDGAVVVKGDRIEAVGPLEELRSTYSFRKEIGSNDHLILPGLINSHHHGRGLSSFQLGVLDDHFERWSLELKGVPRLSPYDDVLLSAIKLVESGVTTVVHMHLSRDPQNYEKEVRAALKAYEDSGLRVSFALDFHDQSSITYQGDESFIDSLPSSLQDEIKTRWAAPLPLTPEDEFEILEKIFHEFHCRGRIKILLGPRGPQWCSDDLLRRVKERAGRYGTGIQIHVLETPYQKAYGLRKYRRSLIEHLAEIGFLGPQVALAHAIWLTSQDIELLARYETSIVHNPSSNLRLGSGIAPLRKYLDHSIPVGLGTDGMGLNDDDDLIQEMRLCMHLYHLPGLDYHSVPCHQIWHMVTLHGAELALCSGEIGTIEVGKKADLILVRKKKMEEPFLHPKRKLWEAFLYRAKASDVETVIIDGEVMMENHLFKRIDKEALMERLRGEAMSFRRPNEEAFHQSLYGLIDHVSHFYEGWGTPGIKPFYIYNSEN
ncbi:MAG: amidohydrolase family protein [Thermodesulfobacteriota bacterium]|jgi:cytosine/adenosine deaminase-related metal-dependent hydrolase